MCIEVFCIRIATLLNADMYKTACQCCEEGIVTLNAQHFNRHSILLPARTIMIMEIIGIIPSLRNRCSQELLYGDRMLIEAARAISEVTAVDSLIRHNMRTKYEA